MSTLGTAPATGSAATATSAARLDDAVKVYGAGSTAVRALDGLSVSFGKAKFTAIMGPSGSGKSSLLHCLSGLDALSGGRAFIGDVELSALGDRELTELRRDRLGFVFQAFNLVPTLSASENITLPLRLAGRRADPTWLGTVVAVTGLGSRLAHRPAEMSGGEQQRVAVARALVGRPDVVFADEPTGNLDSRAGLAILEFLQRAVGELGQTVVMVTHDPIGAAYADTVVFLADGRMVAQLDAPTPAAVLDAVRVLGE
jgi:putative ABC transport system ATP-binding protein